MNAPTSVSDPFTLLTATSTVPAACAGVTAVSSVVLTKVVAAAVPSMLTTASAVKLVPVIVRVSPPSGEPLLGATDVNDGGVCSGSSMGAGIVYSCSVRRLRMKTRTRVRAGGNNVPMGAVMGDVGTTSGPTGGG